MNRWIGKVAVVTGASSGIGANLCKRLAEEGVQVVGFARRVERVQQLSNTLKGKKGKLFAVKCDVTKQEDVANAFKWVEDHVGTVQILVNNAGIFKVGSIIEGNPEDCKAVLETNVLGLTMCTREAFIQMKAAGLPGHIIHINSVAGHEMVSGNPPIMNVYSPSKYAVTCLTEIIRKEIIYAKCHVKVTSISPGYVKTDIIQAAGVDLNAMGVVMAKQPALECDDVSDSILHVLGTPPHVNIQELTIRPYGELVETFLQK